ncbi:MAG: hypothetical protein KAS71_16945, partial [Bacteroidales bacterium]|nr:hypothetical protein [Bacteroidales bacterium]
IIIENCVFEENVFLEEIDLNYGIKFTGCNFIKTLSINECKSNNYDHEFNFDGYHIEFINTQIEGLYFNGSNEIDRGVRISKKSRINKLQVRSIYSKTGSFAINDSTVETLFDVSQARLINGLEIRKNSIINSKVRIENVTASSITFTESTFDTDVHIWAGKIGNLIFNDGLFNDDLFITAVPIAGSMTIIGTEFKKSINFKLHDETNNKTGSLETIYISSGKFNEQFVVNGSNETIRKLTVKFSKQLEGALHFNSCNIKETELSGENHNGNIVFNHSNFNKLSFDFFSNYSTISIISAKAFGLNSELTIQHSNLGKSQFFNTFFNTFEIISIYNSILIDIVVANVKWFNDKNLNSKTAETSPDYTQKKEIYRQIKFVLERQGDRISSLKFKALEMNAYKKELFESVEKRFKRIFNGNRFILWIGQTNDYGQNWIKPILFAIGFGLLFHFLIVIGISEKLSYQPNLNIESLLITWNEYWSNLNTLPQLMNPAHFLQRLFPNAQDISFTVYFLDYLLKIILAFFIYQVISAFRKYMK